MLDEVFSHMDFNSMQHSNFKFGQKSIQSQKLHKNANVPNFVHYGKHNIRV